MPPQPGSPYAPAHNVARRILGSAWWAGFTFNGITAYGDGHDSLIGGDTWWARWAQLSR
jgi:hypothetical protein